MKLYRYIDPDGLSTVFPHSIHQRHILIKAANFQFKNETSSCSG